MFSGLRWVFALLEFASEFCNFIVSSYTNFPFADQLAGQQLHVVGLEPAPREKCEEESEVAANTICTQEKVEGAECKVGVICYLSHHRALLKRLFLATQKKPFRWTLLPCFSSVSNLI